MAMVMARAFMYEFDHIERIDHLITILEGRRNAIFREIDRHRAAFADGLRKRMQNIEDAEFEIVKQKVAISKNERDKSAA